MSDTFLNFPKLERQMGNDNKMFGRLLTDTITSQSQKQNRIDENTGKNMFNASAL